MFKLFIISLIFTLPATAKDKYLSNYCEKVSGKIVKGYKCPKSKLYIPWKFCKFENSNGQKQFFDGCTGPSGGHSDLFYPHCIKHDLCYHHEPASSGKSQKACDRELRDGLFQACIGAKDRGKCRSWARTMYRAVRGFGALAFNCANYPGDY